MTTDDRVLRMYTIFHHPLDYPGVDYLAREFFVTGDGTRAGHIVGMQDTLEAVRLTVPPHADHRLPRAHDDDPTIVETWV